MFLHILNDSVKRMYVSVPSVPTAVGILVEQGMAEVGMALEVGIPALEGRPSVQGSPAVEGTGSQGRLEGSLVVRT